jgi:hypothetical protein
MRLESAVEALARALQSARERDPGATDGAGAAGEPADTVPRAEVAAMAVRLDATIARLRVALADDPRHGEPE